jgi:cysteine-rich repeat protein
MEQCDDANTMNGDGCSSTCIVEPGWMCSGMPSMCTTICGDGIVAGKEVCDPGNPDGGLLEGGSQASDAGDVWLEGGAPITFGSGIECAADCKSGVRVLFADDVEHGPNGWVHMLLSGSTPETWSISSAVFSSPSHSWSSGPDAPSSGDTRLVSPPIDLTSAKVGATVTLEFQNRYYFDECTNPMFDADGAIVEVAPQGGMFHEITPMMGYPFQAIGSTGGGCGNPLNGMPGYSRDTNSAFVPAIFDLTPYIGQVIQLGFHVGWDCGNCVVQEGWFIDDVKITQPL